MEREPAMRSEPAGTESPPVRRSFRRAILKRVVALLIICGVAKMVGCGGLFYHPSQETWRSAEEYSGACEEVFFESVDGTRLHAWFLPSSEKPARGTVIHFHGNAANLTNHVLMSEWLPARGLNLFIFDYRGYGRSEGKPNRRGVIEDSQAALRYVKSRPDVDAERILVYGQSLGGACALAALGEGTDADRRGVRGLLIESSFLWYRDVANDAVGGTFLSYPLVWLLISNAHSPGLSIERLEMPALFLHGRQDGVVPIDNGRAIYEAYPGPKEWLERDGRHDTPLAQEGSVERGRVLKFFLEVLEEADDA